MYRSTKHIQIQNWFSSKEDYTSCGACYATE